MTTVVVSLRETNIGPKTSHPFRARACFRGAKDDNRQTDATSGEQFGDRRGSRIDEGDGPADRGIESLPVVDSERTADGRQEVDRRHGTLDDARSPGVGAADDLAALQAAAGQDGSPRFR